MRLKGWRAWCGVLLLWLLSGCSTLRVAYDTGPTLAWWWIDGYGDFTGDQATRVKDGIRQWFSWHRTTQLPAHAAWLASTRARIGDSITPAQACRWYEEARLSLDPAIDRALLTAAPWVPTLTEAQFRHIEQRYAKAVVEMKEKYLQSDPVERHEASVKRTLEQVDMLYGRLDEAQLKLVSDGIKASPFDPERWLQERQRRQQDTLQTLRRLVAEKADNDRVVAALRALAERSERSPVPAYRAYQVKLGDYNCAFAARIHNAMTPAQRQAARERLKGWEDDLRALTVGATAPP
jgi:uncharacterized coiled-coil protein SlyX